MTVTPVMRGAEKPTLTPKISVQEFAQAYGVSTQTVYRMLKSKQIPGAVRVRNQWRIPANALES